MSRAGTVTRLSGTTASPLPPPPEGRAVPALATVVEPATVIALDITKCTGAVDAGTADVGVSVVAGSFDVTAVCGEAIAVCGEAATCAAGWDCGAASGSGATGAGAGSAVSGPSKLTGMVRAEGSTTTGARES